MDFNGYSFYFHPPRCYFRVVLYLLVLLFILLVFFSSQRESYLHWRVKKNIPQRQWSSVTFRTGDILLNFKNGHFFLFPGHMAVVVELPRYGQKFVWDLQPYHSPTVLKPLNSYLSGSLGGKVYVYQHSGPPIDAARLLAPIKALSPGVHYEMQSFQLHLNACAHVLLGLPGIPDFLPTLVDKNLHSCSSVILQLLIQANVLHPAILHRDPDLPFHAQQMALPIYPHNFLSPSCDLNQYVIAPNHYHLLELRK